MEHAHLGRSGLSVSRRCLGTMNFGPLTPPAGPIIGPRTVAQLDDAQRAVTLDLGDDVLKRLDELFPGYRPGPEHYAW
jgi:aryl-alcohol dehydrogenase-like predicted oxidoreductase